MSSENFHENPIEETVKNLKILHGKSVNVTCKLSEALEAIHQAEDAGNSFVNSFVPNFNIKKKSDAKLDNVAVNKASSETLFVTVKSHLNNDGTFWCRVWRKDDNFDEDILDTISKELGWMEKEMTVKETQPSVLNIPIFFYSEAKSMYCRILVEKELDDTVMARYLDLGISGEISKEFNFYVVPKSMLEKCPFQCIHCCLFSTDQKSFPYEIKWRFNDLTYNQVLMAKITETKMIDNFPLHVLVLKSLLKDNLNVTDALKQKMVELEEDKKEKERYNKRRDLVKTPPPLMPSSEQRRRAESDTKTREKPKKDDSGASSKKSIPLLATIEPVQQDSNTLAYDRNQTNNALLKVITQTVKENLLKSRSREPSCSATHDSEVEIPSRCNSLDSVLSVKKSKRKSKKKSKSKGEIGANDSKNHHSSDTEMAAEKSQLRESDHHANYEPAGRDRGGSVTQASDSHNKKDESIKETGQNQYATWIAQFSAEERRKVPPVIPTLQNLFYNATQLRSEPWWEIEIMNITKLLTTQANIRFYCYDVFPGRLESAMADGLLELYLRGNPKYMLADDTCCSQYILLRSYNKQEFFKNRQRPTFPILGIARLDSGEPEENWRYPVTFLTLSRFQYPVHEFEQSQGKPFGIMNNNRAKSILQAIKKSLANNTMSPSFPEYFPWSGIPPLVENFRKPTSKRQTKANTRHRPPRLSQREVDVCGSSPPEKDTGGMSMTVNGFDVPSAGVPDSTMPEFQEEVWDLDDGVEDDKPGVTETENDQPSLPEDKPKEEELCNIKAVTTDAVQDEDKSSDVDNNPLESEKRCSPIVSPKTDSSQVSSPDLVLEDGKGIYDSSGMWYPSIIAKVIAEAIGRDQRDVNQNPIFPCGDVVGTGKIRILQKPKTRGGSASPSPPQMKSPPTVTDIEKQLLNGHDANSSEVQGSLEDEKGPNTDDSNKVELPKQIPQDLLTLVSSTSECCKEDDGLELKERFERNCQVFDLPSEEFVD